MPIGFKITETMSGYDDWNKPFQFIVTWGIDDFKKLKKSLTFDLNGTITFRGMNLKCRGYLRIDYFNKHEIEYVLFFKDHYNRKDYTYVGKKINIRPWNLLTSHTTCFGVITDSNLQLKDKNTTFFKLKTIPKFLSSFRLTFK